MILSGSITISDIIAASREPTLTPTRRRHLIREDNDIFGIRLRTTGKETKVNESQFQPAGKSDFR